MIVVSYRHLSALLFAAIALSGLAVIDCTAEPFSANAMVAVAVDNVSASVSCNGCNDGVDGMLAAACDTMCGVAVAILPTNRSVEADATGLIVTPANRTVVGRQSTPEPHPPRSVIVS